MVGTNVRRTLYFAPLLLAALLIPWMVAAFSPAQATGIPNISPNEQIIRSFDSKVRVLKNARLDVTETIVIDFQSNQKHGIFRIIPDDILQ